VFRFELARAAFVIASVSACHSSSTTATGDAPEPPKNGRFVVDAENRKICELPLSVYCAEQTCQPFSDAAVGARALVSRTGIWSSVDIGACDAFTYVHRGAWYMSELEYYDASGKLIGADVGVDNLSQFCDGKSGHARYGKIPACTLVPHEIILDGGIP
jgi:hypothetical protein